MHEIYENLKFFRKLMVTPPKVDRNKVPPECRNCMYYRPEFRYRKCLFAACPYGKDRNIAFRKKPLRRELVATGGGGMGA